jgi:hypothetical protein
MPAERPRELRHISRRFGDFETERPCSLSRVSAEISHPAAALAPAAPLLILDDMGKSIGADLEIWKNRSASDLNHSHVWRIASSE